MNGLVKLVVKYLRETADKLDAGNSNISEEEAIDILRVVAHEVLSKETACSYLNMSRSNFDLYVAKGIIPKGVKRRGFKELVWYKDELDIAIKKHNKRLTR